MNWFITCEHAFKAIMNEMNTLEPEHLPQCYPKFVVMYEFFRLLRGEAFLDHRGLVTSDEQKRLYEMQDEIGDKLQALKVKLSPDDAGVTYYLGEMKKQFDV